MAKIRCHYVDCGFLDEGYCSAALIEVDPNQGCMTYEPTAETVTDDEWDEEEEELEEWEDLEDEEEDEDLWLDDADESDE
ncbi:MAG: hypothetical protein LDL12_00280 [Anaerolinea sp.]|nr:hypothetical protein [Anaerolinea sp.]